MNITSRAVWGAKYGRGSLDPGAEPRVVIHHSYKPALTPAASATVEMAAVRSIENYHKNDNGWDGIGYNFLVAPSGRIYEGRGWQYKGAHAGPVNGTSIGVCLLIDGNRTTPSEASIAAVRELIQVGLQLGEISSDYKVSGHRDHMERECPGDKVYARLQEFRHDFRKVVDVPDHTPEVAHPALEPPNLERIEIPAPGYIDLLADEKGLVEGILRATGREALELLEVYGRRVLAGKKADLKQFVDSLADYLKGKM